MFVRFEATEVDPVLGIEVGVFGLVNRLSRRGLLTADQELFRKARNAWFDNAFTDPATVDPTVYDLSINARTKAWFTEATARHLIEEVAGYLEILSSHGVPYQRSAARRVPGRVIYEDPVQVVVVPA